jgi:glycine/D-amino acid oxidase-like deaminating enzyme
MGFAESYCEPNTSIFFCKGKAIRRPAFNQEHVAMFVAAASEYPEYISFDTKDEDYASGSATFQKSYVVNTPLYLSRLKHGLETKYNLKWVAKALTAAELRGLQSSYDFVVVCAGAEVKNLWPDKELPVTYVRGQNVIYQSSSTSSLGDARICGEYVVPIGGGRILGGATHEYSIDDLHKGPDMDTALSILTPSLNVLYPSLKNAVPVSCEAGVRVATQRTHLGKIPQIGIHPELDRTWMLTGLASHGLVHHALVAKLLVTALLSSDGFDSLPAEVRYTPDM